MKTLLVCYTPLHVLIAEMLSEMNEIGEFRLLYICFSESASHQYYFRRLSAQARLGADFLRLRHDWRDPFELVKWHREAGSFNADCLITGNLKHFYSRFLAYLCGVDRFRTFDDGSGNIVESGYFSDLRERSPVRYLFRIIDSGLLYGNVIGRIEVHYTIYPERNVYSNYALRTEKLNLANELQCANDAGAGECCLYLGHALFEDGLRTKAASEKIDRAVFERYVVDFYLPHPRSIKGSHFAKLNSMTVDGPHVAEELVLKLLEKFSRLRVVGVNSSALLNIPTSGKIETVNIDIREVAPCGALANAMKRRGVVQVSESELYGENIKAHN
jgi:N-acetyllactosaminide alpha-2,3-sialyltransferase